MHEASRDTRLAYYSTYTSRSVQVALGSCICTYVYIYIYIYFTGVLATLATLQEVQEAEQ